MAAHQVSYILKTRMLPPVVRHTCDNPLCVNPRHLVGGTQADNMQDMIARDRQLKWDKGATKLTGSDVLFIKQTNIPGKGGNTKALADTFHVSVGYIRQLLRGDKWRLYAA